MEISQLSDQYYLKILEKPGDFTSVENLQRIVWPGKETDIVPSHLILAAAHTGGLVIGAYLNDQLVGFVFGLAGIYFTPDGPRPMHHSHMLAVHPQHRNQGLGYKLKRAQWQMVRHQGLDRITWTYDPLLSSNAHLNINRLGAVCNTYLPDFYGQMQDGLNVGLPSDRFLVDWWINSRRVDRRLSKKSRPALELANYLEAGAVILNPTQIGADGQPRAPDPAHFIEPGEAEKTPIVLVEIPADFLTLKAVSLELALEWRLNFRQLCNSLFGLGYLVTDLIYQPGFYHRSLYALTYGESTL